MYTITGYRETAGNRGLAPFRIEIDADSPEEALEKCGVAFGSYDVGSGEAVFTAAQFADVQVTSDVSQEEAGPVHSSDVVIAADLEPEESDQ